MHPLSDVLPDDALVSVDVGSCTYWYARFLRLENAWRNALTADRPFLVEAVVDRDTPLLVPRQPDEKIEQMFTGIGQEPDGEPAATQLRCQRRQEECAYTVLPSGCGG